ncbi:MAG: sulfurtransferase TusA family protein [Candidatus Omnitrophota bacterium]
MNGYKLPATLDKEINELESLIEKFKKGEIAFTELKAHRVPFGIYEQREPDTYMVRIRCAAGFVTPLQLEKIAGLSSKYGTQSIHLTARQELQIHYVKLDDIIKTEKELEELGMASRGGGGNTVRNIIAQEDAGIDPEEEFDVTPYAISLTTRLISEDDSWTLPRKFKVAFSGSGEDKGYATLADIGFIARVKDGEKGFKVYVAGGLGAKSQTGNLLFDFLPAEEVYNVTKAVKTLFWKYGNRKNKHAARLRFLWQTLGEEEFKRRFTKEYETVKKENHPSLEIEEVDNAGTRPDISPEEAEDKADFELWKSRFVRPQKQEDLFSIIVPVELGFIDNEKTVKLANFLESFGDNVIRFSKDQNFLIRNIPEAYLSNVYNFLKGTVGNFNRPFIYDKILSCAGASTCQLGICLSRGAARAIMRTLKKSELDLDRLSDLKINISGCPNSCGQHPASDLGFFGTANRKAERLYPAYNVVAGAVIRDGETKLAEKVGEVNAKELPELVKDFLTLYLSKFPKYKDFEEYIGKEGKDDLRRICEKYKDVPGFEEDKNYYYDWGSEELFSLAGRGGGECSAGLFDLVGMDLENINKTREELSGEEDAGKRKKLLRDLVFYSSRVLLITRGVEPQTEKEVYDNFSKHFIDTNLVAPGFKDLIKAAEKGDFKTLLEREKEVYELAERVEFLYENMDNSFQFNVPEAAALSAEPEASRPKIVKDYRGVACPMNFVKTKMELAKLKPKEILEIWLDDGEPIENVPGSVKAEGHKILEQKKKDGYWMVVIEKG